MSVTFLGAKHRVCYVCVLFACVRACIRASLHTGVLAYLERKGEGSIGFTETRQFYQVCKDDWHFGKTKPKFLRTERIPRTERISIHISH